MSDPCTLRPSKLHDLFCVDDHCLASCWPLTNALLAVSRRQYVCYSHWFLLRLHSSPVSINRQSPCTIWPAHSNQFTHILPKLVYPTLIFYEFLRSCKSVELPESYLLTLFRKKFETFSFLVLFRFKVFFAILTVHYFALSISQNVFSLHSIKCYFFI